MSEFKDNKSEHGLLDNVLSRSKQLEAFNHHCQLEQLPTELLTRILSELDQATLGRCAQLNKRWRQLTAQPLLWRNSIRIRAQTIIDSPTPVNQLSYWTSFCSSASIQQLHFELCSLDAEYNRRSVQLLNTFLSNSPCLQALTIQGFDGMPTEEQNPLVVLGQSCSQLCTLKLIRFGRDLLTEESVTALNEGCLELVDLEFRQSVLAGPDSSPLPLPQLASLFSRLTRLNFLHEATFPLFLDEMVDGTSIRELVLNASDLCYDENLHRLLSLAPYLTTLKLQFGEFTESHAGPLASGCPNLQSLVLKNVSLCMISATGFVELLNGCPKLRRLKISSHDELDSECYRKIVANLPSGIEDLKLPSFRKLRQPDLQSLLPRCLKRFELPIQELKHGCMRGLLVGLRPCSDLTSLNISDCDDKLLSDLLTLLPRLRRLRLTNCNRLSGKVWENLLKREATQPLPELHEFAALKFSDASLNDEFVAELCRTPVARGLRRLELSDCRSLTDSALVSIAGACPHLTDLKLSGLQFDNFANGLDQFLNSYGGRRVIDSGV
ncbi:hypothetical protein BOX15_Mlig022867g1 [Macrostomum lignano]|uniref:F-box domain-containing protein n=2 Tax=Macrostomum lignano TaxID=282301 RepID=A0A267EMD8_9PLAT|nr:hypothetical protein BOX15_Mlig022867g1 [Macrostomum lignano]